MALRGRQPVQLGGLDNVLRDAAALLIAEAELELRVGNALIDSLPQLALLKFTSH
jgi:hypothetical protein